MGDGLTQEEIDALTNMHFSSEPEGENNENLDKFTSIFLESAQLTLSTFLNKEVLLSTSEFISKTKEEITAENPEKYVISQIVLNGSAQGPFLLGIKQHDATIIVDLILMGEGVAKDDFTEEDEDGFKEAVNQILGAFTITLKETFSEDISLNQSDLFAVELGDASCPIQSLDSNTWKVEKVPLKIGDILTSSIFLFFPEITATQFEKITAIKEEPPEAPIETKTEPVVEQQSSTTVNEGPRSMPESARNIDMLMDIGLTVSVRVGKTEMTLQDILKLGSGAVIELNRSADSPLEVIINNKVIARGEVVVVDANFALRLTQIESQAERIKNLA